MEPSGQRDIRLALAGLQAGCLGSLLMIGWWLLGELVQRRSVWIVPNLLATTFYGERAYRSGFIVPTWSGLAFVLAVYCVAGVVFALAGRERKGGWGLLLVGIATGLVFNWLFFGVALKRLNPLVGIYSPDRLIMVSHLLYGIALVSYPGFARDLSRAADLPAAGNHAAAVFGSASPGGEPDIPPQTAAPDPGVSATDIEASAPTPSGETESITSELPKQDSNVLNGADGAPSRVSDDEAGRGIPQASHDTGAGPLP